MDPIGFEAGDSNLYRFVGNNPENFVDPSGLEEEPPFPSGGPPGPGMNIAIGNPKQDFYRTPKPGNKIVYPGTAAMEIIGFRKNETSILAFTPWSSEAPETREYIAFKMGCIGLNKIRLNCVNDSQFRLPGLQAYANQEDAVAAQMQLVNSTAKDRRVVLWALQVPAPPSVLQKYQNPTCPKEYNMTTIAGAMNTPVAGPGYGNTYDFATAFQNPDGTIRFWEAMPYGAMLNPDLDVHHKSNLNLKLGTVYFVVPIDDHPKAPHSPHGAK